MLDVYADFAEQTLAIPVIRGTKTAMETARRAFLFIVLRKKKPPQRKAMV
jgi:hypothetical protein